MTLLRALSIIAVITTFQSCADPPHVETPVLIEREVINSGMDSFLRNMENEEHFSGIALVMRKGKVIHARGYGMANSEKENSVTTEFHIASITKQFTATAILILVENGIVNLEESINTYLPEEYRTPMWDNVTLHHLLSHTSGITDYAVTREYYNVVKGFCLGNTVDGMIKEAMEKDLEFIPGSKFSYSNIGYTLLGCIIENQTKTPYNDYLKSNIFDPMGMTDSKIHVIGHVPSIDEAEGYRWSDELSLHVPDDVVSLPVTEPDGGLVTTLTDFIKWVGIYLGKKQNVISEKSLEMMTKPYSIIDENGIGGAERSYGYGLIVQDSYLSHGGYIVGFRSDFVVDTQKDLIIVIFTNNTANDPQRISTGLLQLLINTGSKKN